MNQCESLIPMKITTIKSCKCYIDYWKTMKMSTFPYVEFNYSIEKTFSYRIYFYRQDLFFHFCINCFFEIVLSIPLDIIEYENLKGHMGCFKSENLLLEGDFCRGCVNYIIEHYSTMFLTTI